MKRFFLALLFGASTLCAQIPTPQIPLTGTIGSGGVFPVLNSGTISFTSDANHTMTYPEMSATVIKVTSTVSLTATRNLVAPNGFYLFVVENATTGGQAIQLIGSSGTGVSIPNGQTFTVAGDGTNYVSAGGGSGGSISLTTNNNNGAATFTGSTLNVPRYSGVSTPRTSGDCPEFDTNGIDLIDSGSPCGSGSGGINQLTGDVHAGPGSGSQASTLATVNSNVGTFGDATHTVTATANAKGLITGISANAIPTAASGTNGLGSPDNSTIKTSSGVYAVQPVTVSGVACVPGTPCILPAPNVNAAEAKDSSSRLAAYANDLVTVNQFAFAPGGTPDGTHCWDAGSNYTSQGCYGEDVIQTMLAFPGRFSSTDLLSLVNKFIAARNTGTPGPCQGSAGGTNPCLIPVGDFPQTLLPNGTVGQWCSGLDLYCHLATGGGKIAVPLALYLYWQKTGDLAPYAANVAAIKTALALIPVNGTTGCVNITAGQEDIPGNGYMEYMRPTGNVANASVWYAWIYKAMAILATADGDSTNATFFNTQVTSLTGCLQTTLTDSTSKLLWFADGQSKQLDIADSTLAIYPLLGSANGILLSGTQATSISTYLNTNYSSLVNSQGYVKMINACNSGQVGVIPTSGGPPYGTFAGNSLTAYQCGQWATFGGYFAYALGLTSATQPSTYIHTYLNGTLPTTEYYNLGSTTPQGDPALMTTAQTMRMVNYMFPAVGSPATGLCVLDAWGRCTNNVPASTLSGWGTSVTIPFAIAQTNTASFTSGYDTVNAFLTPNAATGAHLINVFGVANSTNNDAYFGFVNAGGAGSSSNYGTLGFFNASPDMNDLITWGYNDGRVMIKYQLTTGSTINAPATFLGTRAAYSGNQNYIYVTDPVTGAADVALYGNNGAGLVPNSLNLLSAYGSLIMMSKGGVGGSIGDQTSPNDLAWDGAGHAIIQHLQSNTASNTDLNGELTLASGTASYSFSNLGLTSHPICVANDTSATNPVQVTYGGGGGLAYTVTFHGTGTDVVDYMCTGRN